MGLQETIWPMVLKSAKTWLYRQMQQGFVFNLGPILAFYVLSLKSQNIEHHFHHLYIPFLSFISMKHSKQQLKNWIFFIYIEDLSRGSFSQITLKLSTKRQSVHHWRFCNVVKNNYNFLWKQIVCGLWFSAALSAQKEKSLELTITFPAWYLLEWWMVNIFYLRRE